MAPHDHDHDTAPPDGRLAWRSVSRLAADTERIVGDAECTAALLTPLMAAIETADAAATPAAARAAAAAELAVAAARLRHAALRLQVAAAALVESTDVHLADAERSPRTWMARHAGLSSGAAAELSRAAETCERFPEIGAAFRRGELTVGHLDAVSRIIPARFTGAALEAAIAQVSEVQGIVLETARRTTVGEFGRFCGRVRDRLDTDGPADRAGEPSSVCLHRLFNGRWSLTGDLSADDGAVLSTILEDLRARHAAAARNGSRKAPPGAAAERPAPSEQRATDLLGAALAGAAADRPGRVGLYLHIDLDDLNAPAPTEGASGLDDLLAGRRPAHTEAGLDISDSTLWGLMADADVTPVFSKAGQALSFGRTRRLAPPILRRVIAHRDRRCRFPGCDRPPIWTEGHHLVHWDDDGETDPSNCAGYCSFHHHAHHDRGFGIAGDAEGELTHTRPDGSELDVEPRYLRRPPDPPPHDPPGDTQRVA